MNGENRADQNSTNTASASTKKKFFSGVAILGFATVIVKIIGLVYKIPLMHSLSEDGMGYFNSAYEIYQLFYVIATAGLPVALSILVAENRAKSNQKNVRRIFSVSMLLFVVIGAVGSIVMLFGARTFAGLIQNESAYYCILAIAPTVFFISISGAIRGYFQGCQSMLPTAVSQVIEALFKLGLGLVLAIWATSAGYDKPTAAAFAILGITAGTGVSMLYLLISKLFQKKSIDSALTLENESTTLSNIQIIKDLFKIAIPVTISSSVVSLTRVIDMSMILTRLQSIGYTSEIANAMYGSYSTLALPIYNLPATFVVAIALSLVPMLTDAVESRDKEKANTVISASVRICSLIAIPCALGITVFAEPILNLLFSGQDEAIKLTSPLLAILGASVLFSCLITISNSILQAYKKVSKPIISMLVGAAVKLISAYILLGIKDIGIYGAPISTLLCCITIVVINFYYVYKYSGVSASVLKTFYQPLLASVTSVGAAFVVYLLLNMTSISSKINTLSSILVAVMLYAFTAILFGAIDKNEIIMLPKGEKIIKVLEKLKLMK